MSGRDPLVVELEAEIGTHLAIARGRSTAPPQIGSRYEVNAILGSGGFGTVVRAHDSELGREVAIKCVPTPDPHRSYPTLAAEARALAMLRAPEIVLVHDSIRTTVETIRGRRPCVAIIMEYVPAPNLRCWTRDPHLHEHKLAVLVSIAKGLEAAHAAGLVHRDIKPENVLVTAQNEARLVDFGLAYRFGQAARGSALAQRGSFGIGTPQYMAPEVRAGAVTPAADQFSFGLLAWELLTGTLPFQSSPEASARAKPRQFAGADRLSRELLDTLGRALCFDVRERFESVEQLRLALESDGGRARLATVLTGVAAAAAIATASYFAGKQGRDRKK